jgi:hypothetical protein
MVLPLKARPTSRAFFIPVKLPALLAWRENHAIPGKVLKTKNKKNYNTNPIYKLLYLNPLRIPPFRFTSSPALTLH